MTSDAAEAKVMPSATTMGATDFSGADVTAMMVLLEE
jgi:hypothetical protein